MTVAEIRVAINFGKEIIEEYKARDEEVPGWVYERMIELYEKLEKCLICNQ